MRATSEPIPLDFTCHNIFSVFSFTELPVRYSNTKYGTKITKDDTENIYNYFQLRKKMNVYFPYFLVKIFTFHNTFNICNIVVVIFVIICFLRACDTLP